MTLLGLSRTRRSDRKARSRDRIGAKNAPERAPGQGVKEIETAALTELNPARRPVMDFATAGRLSLDFYSDRRMVNREARGTG
jgi:hypothetical protein